MDSKLSISRGDDFFSNQRIMDEVWSAIYYAKLCIVECTGQNANVFYELGIAHTLGKPTIMISHHEEEVPFDIRDRRMIIYQHGAEGLNNLRRALGKTIASEMATHYG